MESERFAEIMDESNMPNYLWVQHVSMFLNAEQREAFLDFIGEDY